MSLRCYHSFCFDTAYRDKAVSHRPHLENEKQCLLQETARGGSGRRAISGLWSWIYESTRISPDDTKWFSTRLHRRDEGYHGETGLTRAGPTLTSSSRCDSSHVDFVAHRRHACDFYRVGWSVRPRTRGGGKPYQVITHIIGAIIISLDSRHIFCLPAVFPPCDSIGVHFDSKNPR